MNMARGLWYIFSFKTQFRSVNFKGLPARGDASNPERTNYHDFENKFIEHPIWQPKCGDNSRHIIQFLEVHLDWSRQNLSLPMKHLL